MSKQSLNHRFLFTIPIHTCLIHNLCLYSYNTFTHEWAFLFTQVNACNLIPHQHHKQRAVLIPALLFQSYKPLPVKLRTFNHQFLFRALMYQVCNLRAVNHLFLSLTMLPWLCNLLPLKLNCLFLLHNALLVPPVILVHTVQLILKA